MNDGRTPFIFVLTLRDDLRNPDAWTDAERQAVGAHFSARRRREMFCLPAAPMSIRKTVTCTLT